ncbi:MAG: stage II sporulation protein R [Bacilli bacterium]|nr:stage II sporulation protein R [Bacilli bacterium]
MKKIILLFLSIISLFYVYNNAQASEDIIPDEAIRFRVIANSNTIYDQNIKIQVRNVVQNKIFELINGKETIEDTRNIIKENIDEIDSLVKETLKKLNYDKDYNINYGYNYFPKKEYKGIEYKEGKYESLVITLGDGDGDNWWCVLFPPLCLVEADESDVEDAEYTFFVKELIDKYFK